MAGSGAEKRIQRWQVRFEDGADSLSPVFKRMRDGATARMVAMTEALVAMEEACREVLNEAGASTILYPGYLAFARRIWSMTNRGVAGDTLANEVGLLIAYWTGRGLNEDTLKDLALRVFNVTPPSS